MTAKTASCLPTPEHITRTLVTSNPTKKAKKEKGIILFHFFEEPDLVRPLTRLFSLLSPLSSSAWSPLVSGLDKQNDMFYFIFFPSTFVTTLCVPPRCSRLAGLRPFSYFLLSNPLSLRSLPRDSWGRGLLSGTPHSIFFCFFRFSFFHLVLAQALVRMRKDQWTGNEV